jgi:transposase
LLPLDAKQRDHGLRWLVRSGASWRLMPHDLPPWHTVYQQTQRWLKADCFKAMAYDLCSYCAWQRIDHRRPRVDGLAMTAPNDAKARKSIWLSIRWAIC